MVSGSVPRMNGKSREIGGGGEFLRGIDAPSRWPLPSVCLEDADKRDSLAPDPLDDWCRRWRDAAWNGNERVSSFLYYIEHVEALFVEHEK